MEPIDESLDLKLQEMQAETESLLVQVTDYRKKYPQIATKNYSIMLEKTLSTIDSSLSSIATMSPMESPKDLPGIQSV